MTASEQSVAGRESVVLHVSPSAGRGGTELMLDNLCTRLGAHGYRSSVVTAVLADGWLESRARVSGMPVTLEPRLLGRFGLSAGALLKLRAELRRCRASLVHSTFFQGSLHCAVLARLTGVPLVVNVRSVHYDFATPARRLLWRHLIARYATKVVTVSSHAKAALTAAVGVPEERIAVILNGIDATALRPKASRAAVREALGIGPDALVLTMVGHLRPVKGHRDLVDAVAELRESVPDVVVLLVGQEQEPTAGEVREQIVRLGLGDRVVMLGRRRDIPDLLGASDVFVLPSHSEGISNALLEAAAAGLPTVATAVGGNPEVVVHGSTGCLVEPGNPAALADACRKLAASSALRQQMGAAARERAARLFSIDRMVETYAATFREALDPAPHATRAETGMSPSPHADRQASCHTFEGSPESHSSG